MTKEGKSRCLANTLAMAHPVSRTPILVFCVQTSPDVRNVLKTCKDMDYRKHFCLLLPDDKDVKTVSKKAVVDPEKWGKLPTQKIPEDLYYKLQRNYEQHNTTSYNNMMHSVEDFPNPCPGHLSWDLFGILARAKKSPTMLAMLGDSWEVETQWHCPETGWVAVEALSSEVDGTSKQERYEQRERNFFDLIDIVCGLPKMTTNELFRHVSSLQHTPIMIDCQVNTVGPWPMYKALQEHVDSCNLSGDRADGWDAFEGICEMQCPEEMKRLEERLQKRKCGGVESFYKIADGAGGGGVG